MTAKRNKKAGQKVAQLGPVRKTRVGTENITDEDVNILAKVADGIYSKTDFRALTHIVNSKILPKLRSAEGLSIHEQSATAVELIGRYGLDTLFQLHSSVPEGTMAVQVARQLVTDYDCRTSSEKAVAQVAANAFARILENSRIMSGYSTLEHVDQLQINFYSMVGKELDRATRQFDAAISNLMRMKLPSLRVNVTAKTAFVANNQQINADRKP
jgi:hypothetical protein